MSTVLATDKRNLSLSLRFLFERTPWKTWSWRYRCERISCKSLFTDQRWLQKNRYIHSETTIDTNRRTQEVDYTVCYTCIPVFTAEFSHRLCLAGFDQKLLVHLAKSLLEVAPITLAIFSADRGNFRLVVTYLQFRIQVYFSTTVGHPSSDLYLREWPRQCHDERACKISKSEVS